MGRNSAGVLLYRSGDDGLRVLLVHPGGPYWARKDLGAWSIPKGEYGPDEDPLAAALREFAEETGHRLTAVPGAVRELGTVRQRSGKQVTAFGIEGDLDTTAVVSNTVPVRWPPRSDTVIEVPEVDRAEWFEPDQARVKLNPAQVPFVDRLVDQLSGSSG